MLCRAIGLTNKVCCNEVPDRDAVITVCWGLVTVLAVIVNDLDVDPAGIVTELGIVATCGLLLAIWITTPPEKAGPFKVTVPVSDIRSYVVFVLSVKPLSVSGISTSDACCEDAPRYASIVVDVGAVTVLVETLNVAEVCPLAIVTLVGTVATPVFSEDRSTTVLVVAAPASVTFP